jgi:choline kinase
VTNPAHASPPPAVILAAGDGGRLFQHTYETPKPLIEVAGRPLISYTLEALAEAGVREAFMVTGYRAEQLQRGVKEWLPRELSLRFVQNPAFEGGASLSLRAARPVCGARPFLLVMSDHMLSAAIPAGLLAEARPGGPSLVAIDSARWPEEYAAEATRVRLRPGTRTVAAIGKGIAPWDALDTGAFLLAPEVWDAVDSAPEDCELSAIFSLLAAAGRLHAADVSGARWYDVDTPADLDAARLLVAGEPAA